MRKKFYLFFCCKKEGHTSCIPKVRQPFPLRSAAINLSLHIRNTHWKFLLHFRLIKSKIGFKDYVLTKRGFWVIIKAIIHFNTSLSDSIDCLGSCLCVQELSR
jgi:hypothetical protein